MDHESLDKTTLPQLNLFCSAEDDPIHGYLALQVHDDGERIFYIRSGSAKVSLCYNGQKKRESEGPTNFLGTQIGGWLRKGAMDEPKDLFSPSEDVR